MKFDHRFALTEAGASHRIYAADGVTARLDFLDHMLRVAITRDDAPLLPTWSVCPEAEDVPLEGRDKRSTEGFPLVSPAVTEMDAHSLGILSMIFISSHSTVCGSLLFDFIRLAPFLC